MADCLIVGFNDLDFTRHEERVRRMGTEAGAYKDLALSFVRDGGRPLRALDVMNHVRPGSHLHNADFLWPVVLVLGSSLHRHGHSFDYVNLPHLERETFAEKLAAPDLRAVALTSTLYTEPAPLTELVAFVRAHRRDVAIIMGGPYIAGQAKVLSEDALEEQLRYLGADIYVISAEGETALGRAMTALKRGEPLAGVDNLAYREGDRFLFSKRITEYNVLAETMVDYRLFPKQAFGQFVTTRTAKSCPFSCAFCGFPERAGDYTYLTAADVERELDAIAEIGGVTTITFIDDTFNVPKPRFKEIMRMMIRKNYGFRWNSFFRSDHGDEETIELMARAGCEGVILGIESGSDRILKAMNKTARRGHYAKAIPRLEALGIDCYASLIVGFPGECAETLAETVDLIETAKPSYFRAQLWYCDPITPVYRQRLAHRLKGEGFNWSHATMNVDQACDHIDRLFLSVNEAIWQPQAGFEFWSTFYLQRLGMGRERLRTFLRSFNAGIKEKLLRPEHGAQLSRARVADLTLLSELSEEPVTELQADLLPGERYLAAEKYWFDVLRRLAADERTALVLSEAPSYVTLEVDLRDRTLDELTAAVAVALAVVQGGWKTLVLSEDGEEDEALPIYAEAAADRPFSALVRQVAEARAAARVHRCFGLPLLRRGIRLGMNGLRLPQLAAVVCPDPRKWAATCREFSVLADEVRLLCIRDESGRAVLRSRYHGATNVELTRLLTALLSGGTRTLEELVRSHVGSLSPVVEAEASFTFG